MRGMGFAHRIPMFDVFDAPCEVAELKIDICVCTYRRPSIAETLRSLDRQALPEGVAAHVIVIDNDETPSARKYVEETAASLSVPVTYIHAPANNISIARNAGLDESTAEWIAFIDDDEVADPDWLASLLQMARLNDLDAVFGPAVAVYPENAPDWMRNVDYHSNHPVRRGGVVLEPLLLHHAAQVAGLRGVALDIEHAGASGDLHRAHHLVVLGQAVGGGVVDLERGAVAVQARGLGHLGHPQDLGLAAAEEFYYADIVAPEDDFKFIFGAHLQLIFSVKFNDKVSFTDTLSFFENFLDVEDLRIGNAAAFNASISQRFSVSLGHTLAWRNVPISDAYRRLDSTTTVALVVSIL